MTVPECNPVDVIKCASILRCCYYTALIRNWRSLFCYDGLVLVKSQNFPSPKMLLNSKVAKSDPKVINLLPLPRSNHQERV